MIGLTSTNHHATQNYRAMNKDILVVDDDPDIVEVVATILNMEGYSVRRAYTGGECITQVQSLRPSLILLDLMLPDMNGKDVMKHLSQHDNFRDVPVIVLSAAKEAKDSAQEMGAKACIEKPFDLQDLLTAVKVYQSN